MKTLQELEKEFNDLVSKQKALIAQLNTIEQSMIEARGAYKLRQEDDKEKEIAPEKETTN